MKKMRKIILALIIGFVAAVIIMAVAIYFGYSKAYSLNSEFFTVRIIGIPIYQLSKIDAEYFGTSNGIFMGAFCGVCMIISMVVEEIISGFRSRKNNFL